MTAILPFLGLLLVEAVVWIIAYRLQRPDKSLSGNWATIDRNVRLIIANVTVICFNVVIVAIITVIRVVAR